MQSPSTYFALTVNNDEWTEDKQVKGIESAFPDDVASIMLTDGMEDGL